MPIHDLTPQLRTRLRRVEKLVGLFVAVAVALLLAGFAYYLYHTAERRGWFTPKVRYFTYVESAAGLNLGDPVLLMGFSVGEITEIEAMPPNSWYNVFLAFEVKQPYYGYIWTDSVARITAGGFLGGRQLEVTKGRTGKPTVYEEDGEIARIRQDGELVAYERHAKGVAIESQEAPALAERADQMVAQVEEALPRITAQLEALLQQGRDLATELDTVLESTRPVIANLDTITRSLRDPDGSLGRWILPPELRTRIDAALDGIDSNLSVLSGTLRNVDALTGSVREQLERNPDVLGDVSDLVRDTDDLVQGLKRHWLLRSAFPQPAPPEEGERIEPLPGIPGAVDP